MHHEGQKRKISEYGRQLREKQKVKRIYGVMERQFRRYFTEANRRPGGTGENLLKILETRLDNVLHKAGFVANRREGRKLVSHGHVRVNGKKVNIPSYEVRTGEKITLSDKAINLESVKKSLAESLKKRTTPTWIDMNFDRKEAVVKNAPIRTDITIPVQEQLIVELYSK
jgi:small subunit ribosomal protein S4